MSSYNGYYSIDSINRPCFSMALFNDAQNSVGHSDKAKMAIAVLCGIFPNRGFVVLAIFIRVINPQGLLAVLVGEQGNQRVSGANLATRKILGGTTNHSLRPHT